MSNPVREHNWKNTRESFWVIRKLKNTAIRCLASHMTCRKYYEEIQNIVRKIEEDLIKELSKTYRKCMDEHEMSMDQIWTEIKELYDDGAIGGDGEIIEMALTHLSRWWRRA